MSWTKLAAMTAGLALGILLVLLRPLMSEVVQDCVGLALALICVGLLAYAWREGRGSHE